MVPDVAGIGHSFKGAMAYYLHDKRGSNHAAHLSSSERVEWTETRNLATSDMRTAERVMIATAKRAAELKREAGIVNTGRKSNAHVYAYSLSWHPSERPDRAEMVRAADETLKAIGADKRQAVIVAHTDRAHSHLHIIVNRVDPNDGRMLSTSNDRLKLSDWANGYERQRGNIVTPKREEQRQQRQQHADRKERQDHAAKARIAAQEGAHVAGSQIASLKEIGAAQGARHSQEWRDLAAANKVARSEIYKKHGARMKDAIARHKSETKQDWRLHFQQQRSERRSFESRERSLAGRLLNAWDAVKQQRIIGQLSGRGLLGETIRQTLSGESRQDTFQQTQNEKRTRFMANLKASLDREIQAVKAERGQALAAQRQIYQTQRATLIGRQSEDRTKLSEAWNAVKATRLEQQRQGAKPHWNEKRQQQSRQSDGPAKSRSLFFEAKNRLESQTNSRGAQENFFARKDRIEREQREKPRVRDKDRDRDR